MTRARDSADGTPSVTADVPSPVGSRTQPVRAVLATVAACVGAVMVAGCGPESPPVTMPPSEPTALVLRLEQAGGLVPPGLPRVPQFSLYGDGRVVTTAAPGTSGAQPALPALQQRRLSRAGIRRVLLGGRDAGLEAGADYGQVVVPDAPVTTFTLVSAGRRRVVRTVGLSLEPSAGTGSLTSRQSAARRRLRAFESRLLNPDRWLADVTTEPTSAYRGSALAAFAAPAEALGSVATAARRSWPLGDLASAGVARAAGRCQVVRGRDLVAVLSSVRGASNQMLWRSGGAWYHVQLRPLLPDERNCADVLGRAGVRLKR
jgi:hypothetical protein